MRSERLQRQIERLLDQCEESISHREWVAARELAEAVLRMDPDNADARAYLEAAVPSQGGVAIRDCCTRRFPYDRVNCEEWWLEGLNVDTLGARIRAALVTLTVEQLGELTCAIERLIAALGPDQIYVFGSHARGDATIDSDVDILVVVPDSEAPMRRRAQAAYEAVGSHRLPLDILVMPRAEFERRRAARASLPATVLREGQLLYAA